jgi:hypothetical protein
VASGLRWKRFRIDFLRSGVPNFVGICEEFEKSGRDCGFWFRICEVAVIRPSVSRGEKWSSGKGGTTDLKSLCSSLISLKNARVLEYHIIRMISVLLPLHSANK